MSATTIQHPTPSGVLYPQHELSMRCWCTPERTVQHKRRSSGPGWDQTIHIWHHDDETKKED